MTNSYLKNNDAPQERDNKTIQKGKEEFHATKHTTSNHSTKSSRESFPYQPSVKVDDRLQKIILRHEIRKELADRLHALANFEIIILCDDSGSMNTQVDGTTQTRWDELREFVKIILEIGTIFDSSGVDIYFLNREPIPNVKNPEKVNHIFDTPPAGYTPLVPVLRHIFKLPATRRGNDKKALVFVATDGAPTDDEGNVNVNELKTLMNSERRIDTTFIMFLICTDDPACVDYLNDWDKTMTNVDVTDDYKTEREKIQGYQGKDYPFSKGDYIVKALIGAIDRKMDDLNEKVVQF
ncbi:hypothetical protein I4U23_022956 [Adineta vaga]|nr:hypothetical protein I4U23_022956 [Adineta vaga]